MKILTLERTKRENPPIRILLFARYLKQVTKPEFTIRWHWQAGDIVFWDNRTTQHYAVYDYDKTVHRIINRVIILK